MDPAVWSGEVYSQWPILLASAATVLLIADWLVFKKVVGDSMDRYWWALAVVCALAAQHFLTVEGKGLLELLLAILFMGLAGLTVGMGLKRSGERRREEEE